MKSLIYHFYQNKDRIKQRKFRVCTSDLTVTKYTYIHIKILHISVNDHIILPALVCLVIVTSPKYCKMKAFTKAMLKVQLTADSRGEENSPEHTLH